MNHIHPLLKLEKSEVQGILMISKLTLKGVHLVLMQFRLLSLTCVPFIV